MKIENDVTRAVPKNLLDANKEQKPNLRQKYLAPKIIRPGPETSILDQDPLCVQNP